ncbi:hypothetical protein [Solirubrobacter soli]|uniref:hypothetical protein n=1 Tax=Solirubrobacter soli TaxID=363832 RepID=UPI00041C6714|nr:hypothetical protein [Solirubrobacter soli]
MRASTWLWLAAASAVAGCGGHAAALPSEPPVVAHAVAPPALPIDTPTPTPTPRRPDRVRPAAPAAILSPADRSSFDRLVTQLGGAAGVSVSGLGREQRVEHLGNLRTGIAWSTSKVPIALAAVTGGRPRQADLVQAITASDNAAATRLWNSLGAGDDAAHAADSALAAAGDTSTHVQSRAIGGPGYTPFGQTEWSLDDQARFTAGMVCVTGSDTVLSLMGQVVPGQRWGLGSAGVPASFKGGWGPGTQPGARGGWLDRQLGIINLGDKALAVSIASNPTDGSHETATRNLTLIARWLVAHADARVVPPTPRC